ncbi:MAG TPA: ribonuclease P protein component [Candidatus Paceibacterota bacterium]
MDRNLIKRWVREAFRTKQVNLLTGVYTVRVGKGIIEKKYHDIEYLLHNSLRAFL